MKKTTACVFFPPTRGVFGVIRAIWGVGTRTWNFGRGVGGWGLPKPTPWQRIGWVGGCRVPPPTLWPGDPPIRRRLSITTQTRPDQQIDSLVPPRQNAIPDSQAQSPKPAILNAALTKLLEGADRSVRPRKGLKQGEHGGLRCCFHHSRRALRTVKWCMQRLFHKFYVVEYASTCESC